MATLTDGLQNLVAGIATEKDKASSWSYYVTPRAPQELEMIYRGSWIGRKVVDIPVEDMTRRWRFWSADDPIVEKIEAAEKKFAIRQKVTSAARWARLYGSSAIIIGSRRGAATPDRPLDLGSIGKGDLLYLHVEINPGLTIDEWENDVGSPYFGQPKLYNFQPQGRGGAGATPTKIHASRVIPFCGVTMPIYAAQASNGWGDSVYTSMEQTLATAGGITATIASLIPEAKVDIITVKGLVESLATLEGENAIKRRFSLANFLKSVNNTILMGEGETFDQKQFNFAGLSDIHMRIMQEVSGAADIPATRFLGQAPAGMSSTGESDLRNYYDSIGSKQESELRPALDKLDRIVFASEGITLPTGSYFGFLPLWQETPEVRAKNTKVYADAAKVLNDTGLIDDEALAKGIVSRLVEDGAFPALDEAVKAMGDDAFAPEPDEADLPPPPAVVPPRLKVVGSDAAPRTLYVSRKVTNGAAIIAWAKAQGFKTTLAASDLHVTIAFSRAPVDWMKVSEAWSSEIKIAAGGPRVVETFDGGAVVLLIKSSELEWRHQAIREAGASWDWPEYQPHITITHEPGEVDADSVEPYAGEIHLGPEIFAELDDDDEGGEED